MDDQGKASHVDLAKAFAALKKHGYKGYCSIKYTSRREILTNQRQN